MGGGSRTRTSSQEQQNSTSTVSTPGTAFGTNVLQQINDAGITSNILDQERYTGPVVAPPTDVGAGNYAAQWGTLPSTFVPQRTATDSPTQVDRTYVASNYQPGIDAGLQDAEANRTAISGAIPGMYSYWTNIANNGGENPYLQQVIDALNQDFNERSAQASSNRALTAGAEGAFGGTPFQQGEQWAAEQEAQAYGSTISGLRYQDFMNTQQLMNQAPGQLADIAALGTLGANQMLQYGGLQQQNLQEAAATGDYNAQVLMNNLNQAQQLNDANAIAAAQDEIQRWQAQYQSEQARIADLAGRTQTQQEIDQAAITNAMAPFQLETEQYNNILQQLESLMGIGRAVPGGTTTASGTASGTSTSRTSNSVPWAQLITSMVSAGMQASDIRVKKNIEPLRIDGRGVKWYRFHYLWQKDDEQKHEGVIAQELQELAPEFVINHNGLLMVNYFGLMSWRFNDARLDAQ